MVPSAQPLAPQPQPKSPPTPEGLEACGGAKKNGFKRTVYSKNSLVKYSRGLGAGAENQYPRGPRGGAIRCSGLARIPLLGVSRSNGRKRGHVEPIQGPRVVH